MYMIMRSLIICIKKSSLRVAQDTGVFTIFYYAIISSMTVLSTSSPREPLYNYVMSPLVKINFKF
jgi:hypothetical protein